MEVDKLVKMANHIAANMDYGPDKDKIAAGVADHIKRFWTPEMRGLIVEAYRGGDLELTPLAASAIEKLEKLEKPKATSAA